MKEEENTLESNWTVPAASSGSDVTERGADELKSDWSSSLPGEGTGRGGEGRGVSTDWESVLCSSDRLVSQYNVKCLFNNIK